MQITRPLRLVVLCAALAGAPASLFAAAEVTMVGPWRILAGTSTAGPYCTMQLGTATTKVVGIQVRTNGVRFMSVCDPGWTLTPQQQMPVKIVIDGKQAFEGKGIAVMANVLVIPLPDGSDAVEAIGDGKSLTATLEKGEVTYDLAGAGAARDTLKTCLDATGKT